MLLLGDVGQQLDIRDLQNYINDAIKEIDANKELDQEQAVEIANLKKENRELKLYTLGLARLLSSKGLVTEDELKQLVSAVDSTR